ncbi:carbohydrate sulfotransferase 1-like isoform X2 [Homarus americanus]|uniref:carbohydrate sulfotransferase 1-like isoform X2 n=1 Tax=Homarus americanus TaxID=6706 RepID=UPI001C48C77D|nr:carbohydrate sulfotransferase 1-like isoform X2 [Homarus americanus]
MTPGCRDGRAQSLPRPLTGQWRSNERQVTRAELHQESVMTQTRVLGSKGRRLLLVLLLVSLLLASHIITNHAHPELEEVNGELPNTFTDPRVAAVEVKGAEPVNTRAAKSTSTYISQRLGREMEIKQKLLSKFEELDAKELQHVLQLLESTRNPRAVQATRIDHALQSLKVTLLEEISGKKYSDISKAVIHAQTITSQPRPAPLKVVIATTWRSGSTFLEELLASYPAVYNHYEPLMQFGLRRIREGLPGAAEAQETVHDLLSCKYEGHEDYILTAQKLKEMISRNTRLWNTCNTKEWGDALCFNDVFLKEACKLFPWSIMKIVRLQLKLLRPILEDSQLNTRIVYLVRDPRGVINSRTDTVRWCHTEDCKNPENLCRDMDDDLTTALQMQKDFPGKVYILRYEDMSLEPLNKTHELLEYVGLDFDPRVKEFLVSHTTKNFDKPWSTSRESKTRVTYWVSKLPSSKLKVVQSACTPVMKRFGYIPITSNKNITVENILGPLVLPTS